MGRRQRRQPPSAVRILVVDDSPVVRQVICRILRGYKGWEVCGEAADGQDAVQKVRQLSPDLVILDFLMPGLNGLEAAREITRAAPKVPILLCMVYLSRQLMELAEDVGVTGTLSKSNLGELVTGIETLLRGDRFFREPRRLDSTL